MQFSYFIGCDVSKSHLDFAVMHGKQFLFHKQMLNTPDAIKVFLKELSQIKCFALKEVIFCMEHTGIYSNYLLTCLHKKKINICLQAATQIKNSLGNIRGKNDKVDAIRIAEYAYKNREELRLWQPKREVIQELAQLSATRTRLIDAQKLLTTPVKENSIFVKKKILKKSNLACNNT